MDSAKNIAADLLLLRDKLETMKTYNLTDRQYDLLQEFYNHYKSYNNLISNNIVKKFLIMNINLRQGEIKASELDVTRMIELLSSTPGYLTFNQLVDLLNLALASRSKISFRILQFLNNKDRFKTINPDDGKKYCNFFTKFYSPTTGKLVQAHKKIHKENKVFELINILKCSNVPHLNSRLMCVLSSSVDKKLFAEEISQYLVESVFV